MGNIPRKRTGSGYPRIASFIGAVKRFLLIIGKTEIQIFQGFLIKTDSPYKAKIIT